MSPTSQANFKRSLFLNVNKYQRPILYLILLPSLFSCTILFSYILYFQFEVISTLYSPEVKDTEQLMIKSLFVFGFLLISFLGVVLWAFRTSSNLVGAFERIITELDAILAGKGKKHVYARKDDQLANDLLKRVNALIDKLP